MRELEEIEQAITLVWVVELSSVYVIWYISSTIKHDFGAGNYLG